MARILAAVRGEGAATQAEIVRITGLGRAVVAERIAKLTSVGLLETEGPVVRGPGRPSRQLRINGSAGYLLVASLNASRVTVAIANAAGACLLTDAAPVVVADGPDVALGHIDRLFEALCARSENALGPLLGVGIGIPGPVEFSTGRPVAPAIMPGWDGYPITERLGARYGVPVFVDSDVNVLTLGEWRQGVARGHNNVVFLKIGTGIGVGIISDGALRRGEQGAAGDIGHIQVTDDPSVVCRCGNIGCLEPLAGGFAIARQGEQAAQEGRSPFLAAALARDGVLSAATVGEAAARRDPASTEILQRAGRFTGTMLAGVVNLLNPSLVVIGGGVARSGDVFLAAVRESVYRRALPLASRHLVITLTALDDRAAVIGAASMVLDELYSDADLGATLARVESTTERGRVA